MRPDPIELEVFKHLFHSIAEEMGAALRRTAFSPNIKERRDYSCALFDAAGNALAMGDHMPVHLGSMPLSVRAAIAELPLAPGDVAMLNDPFRGGTHLPDITVVAPVFVRSAQPKMRRTTRNAAPEFFVAARAHHADVGGTFAGSMGPCREIYQEGFRIPPVKIVRAGTLDRDILTLLLNNVRTPEEREGDLSAQLAACHTGGARLRELCARYGIARVQHAAHALLDYSEKMMRTFLETVPAGTYAAEDVLDDDGVTGEPVRIAVRITFPRGLKSVDENFFRFGAGERFAQNRAPQGRNNVSPGRKPWEKSEKVTSPFRDGTVLTHTLKSTARNKPRPVVIDFTGSSPQVEGSINAVEAITYSACFYVFRCLLREDVPATAGLMRPIHLIAPEGTVVNARPPAAVAGGNVETSQRIVDVLLRALAQALPEQIPAASSGTMNNLTIGGIDDRPAARSGSLRHVSTMALEGPRLQRLQEKSASERFVSGHDFSRADKSSFPCHPERSATTLRRPDVLASAGPANPFAYYETIAGGSGASAHHDGVSGVHTHMTNSLNTPVEALEYSYPLRVTKYALRRAHSSPDGPIPDAGATPPATRSSQGGRPSVLSSPGDAPPSLSSPSPQASLSSGGGLQPGEGSAFDNRQLTTDNFLPGAGKHRGGDGIVREIEVLTDATMTILSDRRKSRPYGLAGGEPGAPGRTVIFRADGSTELMPSKGSTRLRRGDRIRIETPGGGGWGLPAHEDEDNSD
jgi:N-methylhydantoinase B